MYHVKLFCFLCLQVHNLSSTGTRFLETRDYDEALRCYEEALEIDEYSIESLCGRAEVYLELGKYVLAQLDAEKVLAIQAKNSKVKFMASLELVLILYLVPHEHNTCLMYIISYLMYM